jgi:hypothetical protein
VAKPASKSRIIKRLGIERKRLEQFLSTLSRVDMLAPGVVGEWSVKDVLAHLADWEAHMSIWMNAARGGDPVEQPDPGLTWRQLDLFNDRVYEAHRDQPLDEVLAYFHEAHRQFMELVDAMPEAEMLTLGAYPFLGKDTIYKWLVAYADHDAWGKKEISKWFEARPEAERKVSQGPDA